MTNKLHNRITTDIELVNWCKKNVPGFVGVIDRTNFEEKARIMKPGESVIINLDPGYKNGGTHWVAFRVSSEAPIAYYKDSFGAPPPNDIRYSGIVYGNRINQKLSEVNCGKRAAEWLRDINKAAHNGREIEWFENSELSDSNGGNLYKYPAINIAKKKAARYGVNIESSEIYPHKLKVEYNGKMIHFGHREYSDYNLHKDKKRRARYRVRARGIGSHNDPNSANFWAYHILW